jgi:hypothetical protein
MKKLLLAISFVFAFTLATNAQAKKTTAADAPATEKAQPGDANYTPPTSASPATVNVKETNKAEKGTKKACSKAKSCKKGKSCCKKSTAKTSAKEGKACCKKGAKACGKHTEKTSKTSATKTTDKPSKAASAAETVEN